MVNVDFNSGVPIVEQIVTKISNLIKAGAFNKNDKIMSVSELSKTLTTSFSNVSQAYKQLEEMGFIYSDCEEFYVGKQNSPKQNNTSFVVNNTVNNTSKSQKFDSILQNLEDNITLLIENDFTEEYLIEIINKQENLLKDFEKNTATLLQQGFEKEKIVELVKTLNRRLYD